VAYPRYEGKVGDRASEGRREFGIESVLVERGEGKRERERERGERRGERKREERGEERRERNREERGEKKERGEGR